MRYRPLYIFKYACPCFPSLSSCVPLRFRNVEPFHEFPVGSPLFSVHSLRVKLASAVHYTVRSLVCRFTKRFPAPSPYIRLVFHYISRAFYPVFRLRSTLQSSWFLPRGPCGFIPAHSPCFFANSARFTMSSLWFFLFLFFFFFFFVTFPWQFNRPVFSSFLYICRVFLSFLVCSVLCQSDRPIVGEESPRFTVCSPWVTRYLSCTCVFPSVSISCDTCFPCIALYVTAEFHHEFPVGYLSLTFSMRSVSFAVSSVLCPRCVSLYRNYVLHYLPANFSYKFAVRSLTFLVCSTMCSPCVSLNGTLTFYHGFPMDSLPFPISSLVFFCVSSEFRALRSSYVARHGAPTFQHEFTVGSPISFLHIHGVSGHLSLDFLLMSHVGFARLLVYFVILSYVLCLLYDY